MTFSALKDIFKGQLFHYFLLYFLLAGVYQILSNFNGFLDGEFWGIPTKFWLMIALLSPIVHQIYVWMCWRFEWHQQFLSIAFEQSAFPLFKVGFLLLFLSRPASIIVLALANQNSFSMSTEISYALSIAFAIPSVLLFYSVKKYFGFDRAFGKDHFDPQAYKTLPMVKEGMFKYTPNAMYVFGFLILYLPGFIWFSKAALLAALFNHLYIWVHYYFTEKPDMDLIYKDKSEKRLNADAQAHGN